MPAVTEYELLLADTQFNNADTRKHGLAPKLPGDATKFYDGTGAFSVPAGGISPTIVDAKGDLIVGTANDTVAREAVGANNTVLAADSAQTTGVKWAQVGEAMIALADVTTWNVSPTAHGFAPKTPADVTQVLRGDGTWGTVTASGGGSLVLISDKILGVGAPTFDFTSIPGGYKYLQLYATLRCDKAGAGPASALLTINNDSGNNYIVENLQGNNGTAASSKNTPVAGMRVLTTCAADTAGFASEMSFVFLNYAETTFNKTAISEGMAIGSVAGTAIAEINGHMWLSTAAVTRLTVTAPSASNFIAGSHATLYGLAV